jgi:hypothetical protein
MVLIRRRRAGRKVRGEEKVMKANLIVAVSAAALVAGCGSEGAENLSANVQAGDVNAQNVLRAEPADANAAAPDPAAVESGMPVPGSNVQEKQVFRERESPRPPRRPEPAAEPEEPADPHAGHDMNNMAH